VSGSQLSSVHEFPSVQAVPVPGWHWLSAQVSPAVQEFPSSQAAVLALNAQPVDGWHTSFVQRFPSLQDKGVVPAEHVPLEQVSPIVQTSPSLQLAVLSVYMQPSTGSQLSSVQALASLQVADPDPMHAPPVQVSVVVQAFPSLHAAPLAV